MTTLTDLYNEAVNAGHGRIALADAPNRESFAPGAPRRFGWADLHGSVSAAVQSLTSLGVQPGDRVAIQLPNVVELPVLILACSCLGAIAVPFPVQHRSHELREGFNTAEVSLVVTADRPDRPDQLSQVGALVESLNLDRQLSVASINPAFDGLTVNVEPPDNPESIPVVADTSPDSMATICWTSGTTGTPKGVPRTHAMWAETARFQVDELSLTDTDRILCPFPLVNMAGIGGMLVPWLMSKSALFLHQPLDLPVFLHQLQSERATYTVAPPPLLNMLIRDQSVLGDVDLSALRVVTSGSAPLDSWMIEGWEALGVEICNAFGSNEGVSLLSTRRSVPDPAQRARLFPEPERPGVEVAIIDRTTGESITELGRPGELLFRGPIVFDGYLDSDGSEFDDDWFRSGDIFEWATERSASSPRLLRFVDRAKDIIIRGGMNISAAEVESFVSTHPAVGECAAVGYPDTDLGERVGVFVVKGDQEAAPELDEVVEIMRAAGVASYKLPERLEVIEQLPRNAVGKVMKPKLRSRWSA